MDPYLVVSKLPIKFLAKISKNQVFSVNSLSTEVNFSPWVFKSKNVGKIIIRLVTPDNIDTIVKSKKVLILFLKSHVVWTKNQKIKNIAIIYPK